MSHLLLNKMTVKTGKRDEVINILLESGKAFDDNEDCLLYIVSKDQSDETVIWVQDAWTSQDAHKRAMSRDQMKMYIQKAIPLLEGMPEQIEIEYAGGKGL